MWRIATLPADMSIRGVIFDMDGVLCDSEEFISHAAQKMFTEQHGVAVQPADFLPFVGARGRPVISNQ